MCHGGCSRASATVDVMWHGERHVARCDTVDVMLNQHFHNSLSESSLSSSYQGHAPLPKHSSHISITLRQRELMLVASDQPNVPGTEHVPVASVHRWCSTADDPFSGFELLQKKYGQGTCQCRQHMSGTSADDLGGLYKEVVVLDGHHMAVRRSRVFTARHITEIRALSSSMLCHRMCMVTLLRAAYPVVELHLDALL